MAFARIVTHYVHNYAWLEDGGLLRDAAAIADIPGVMVNGRLDFKRRSAGRMTSSASGPVPKLVIVNDAGHDASNASITVELVSATNRFANPEKPRTAKSFRDVSYQLSGSRPCLVARAFPSMPKPYSYPFAPSMY